MRCGVRLTRVEEQSVRLACAKVQRDRILAADDWFAARLAQVVGEELGAAERGFGWCFVCACRRDICDGRKTFEMGQGFSRACMRTFGASAEC